MGTMNRRDVVKRAAGLAVVGAGGFAAGRAGGQEAKKDAAPPPPEVVALPRPRHSELPVVPGDPMLERTLENPFAFMFMEEAVFSVGPDKGGYPVVFASAFHPWAIDGGVSLRVASMVVFRADAGRDDFTSQGGVYWRCDTAEGKFQYKASNEIDGVAADGTPRGALILAVRELADTVRCYRLILDLRC